MRSDGRTEAEASAPITDHEAGAAPPAAPEPVPEAEARSRLSPARALRSGGILLLILALARAAGGAMLMILGPGIVDSSRVTGHTARTLGGGLIVVALVAAAASVGCMRRSRWGWTLALVALALFIVDGALNGLLLFGRPGDTGTIVNVLWAGLVLGFLLRGRAALAER